MSRSRHHTRETLLSFLQEHGVDCVTHNHPAVSTVEEQANHVGHLDGCVSKNLFLKVMKVLDIGSTASATESALAMDAKSASVGRLYNLTLSARLGLGKGGVRVAPEESLQSVLQVPPTCVSPFALINESARSVALLLDVGFQKQSRVFFHPLSNDVSTAVTTENLDKFLKAIGREPSYVDFEAVVVVGKDQPPDLAPLVPKEVAKETESQQGTTELKALATKQAAAAPPKKTKAVVPKTEAVVRVDVCSVLASVLDDAVAAAVAGIHSSTLENEKKQAVAEAVDAAIRHRLAPDLESLLMTFKNTVYAEGFKSATESLRLSSAR